MVILLSISPESRKESYKKDQNFNLTSDLEVIAQ